MWNFEVTGNECFLVILVLVEMKYKINYRVIKPVISCLTTGQRQRRMKYLRCDELFLVVHKLNVLLCTKWSIVPYSEVLRRLKCKKRPLTEEEGTCFLPDLAFCSQHVVRRVSELSVKLYPFVWSHLSEHNTLLEWNKFINSTLINFWCTIIERVKNGVVWDVMPCGSCKDRCFGVNYRHHYQDEKNLRVRNNVICN
jgi:hypothetical protein